MISIPIDKKFVSYWFLMTILIAVGSNFHAFGQIDKRDSLNSAIKAYRTDAARATEIFLNSNLPEKTRLDALRPYPHIYDDRKIEAFKSIILSEKQPLAIRAMAVEKITPQIEEDESLYNLLLKWFQSPNTPETLRNAAFEFFKIPSIHPLPGLKNLFTELIRDENMDIRSFAFMNLAVLDDARAQQILIDGLERPQNALLDQITSMEILNLFSKKEFYPTFLKIAKEEKNPNARLLAIQSIGPYAEATPLLQKIALDANEKENVRISALQALTNGTQKNNSQIIKQILEDEKSPEGLQIIGIQLAINQRNSMSYRRSKAAQNADELDRLILSIKQDEKKQTSKQLAAIAEKYLLMVKPNFN